MPPSPGPAPHGPRPRRLLLVSGGHERGLARAQFGAATRIAQVLDGDGELGAPVEQGRVAPLALPLDGGFGELLTDQQTGPIGVQPAAQPGPGPDQGLVGDQHSLAVHGQQAGLHEGVEDGTDGIGGPGSGG